MMAGQLLIKINNWKLGEVVLAEIYQHFGLSEKGAEDLKKHEIDESNLFGFIKFFDTLKTFKPLSIINLYLYADKDGNFFHRESKTKTDLIACSMLECLNLPFTEKMNFYSYLEYAESGFKTESIF